MASFLADSRDGVALALARNSCGRCHGYGLRSGRLGLITCECVLRAVFRVCLANYRLTTELLALGAPRA